MTPNWQEFLPIIISAKKLINDLEVSYKKTVSAFSTIVLPKLPA
jgi:hypothetical protein